MHKPDSLWTLLNKIIRERGQISYGELCQIVAEEGFKAETATRRLRKSESPNVGHIIAKSKRNTDYIAGYKWVGEPEKPESMKSQKCMDQVEDSGVTKQ
jgi:hypothetical protein